MILSFQISLTVKIKQKLLWHNSFIDPAFRLMLQNFWTQFNTNVQTPFIICWRKKMCKLIFKVSKACSVICSITCKVISVFTIILFQVLLHLFQNYPFFLNIIDWLKSMSKYKKFVRSDEDSNMSEN